VLFINNRDLKGRQFGYLKVLRKDEKNPQKWVCICNKDNVIKSFYEDVLLNNRVSSCGCSPPNIKIKYNTYDLTGSYGIGFSNNKNNSFYFDLEDFEKIRYWCWIENDDGYISARHSRTTDHKVFSLHRYVTCTTNHYTTIDHIDHNPRNCLKENLRPVSMSQNQQNRVLSKYNTSGIKGVSYDKTDNQWRAYITFNKIRIEKRFENFDDAVLWRKRMEEKYHGEYSYEASQRTKELN